MFKTLPIYNRRSNITRHRWFVAPGKIPAGHRVGTHVGVGTDRVSLEYSVLYGCVSCVSFWVAGDIVWTVYFYTEPHDRGFFAAGGTESRGQGTVGEKVAELADLCYKTGRGIDTLLLHLVCFYPGLGEHVARIASLVGHEEAGV
jgi:hypothetical protein